MSRYTRWKDAPEEMRQAHLLNVYSNGKGWTTEPPTVEGWYWVVIHDKHDESPQLVQIEKYYDGSYLGINNGDYLETLEEYIFPFSAHWLGPLPVPEPPKE